MNALAIWAEYAYRVAVEAGEVIRYYYENPSTVLTQYKADQSPLTNADQAAHKVIFQALSQYQLDPAGSLPVLSEEGQNPAFVERQRWLRYWCIDPLDGTKEFLAKNGEFSVNIALIENNQPVIGIIYLPAQRQGYLAWRDGGAYHCDAGGNKERIYTQHPPSAPLRVLVSRHFNIENMAPWISTLGDTHFIKLGSALKFCALASGKADLFLRLTPTAEWDNAAGHCIVEEAGGALFTFDCKPLTYNRTGSLKQVNFIVAGDKSQDWKKIFCG